MSYSLRVIYDERDNLEAWIPEFDVASAYEREAGPYEMFNNAKPEGSGLAFDWLLIESFSHAYALVINEAKDREASIPDRYNVPEFGLYDVPLSEVLEYVYRRLVPKWEAGWEVVVLQHTIHLPEDVERLIRIGEDSRVRLRIVDKDTLQLTRIAE